MRTIGSMLSRNETNTEVSLTSVSKSTFPSSRACATVSGIPAGTYASTMLPSVSVTWTSCSLSRMFASSTSPAAMWSRTSEVVASS